MDTRTQRPLRTAVSLGLGVALVATAGVVAVTPVVTALANQSAAATPAAARPAPAALHATVVRSALAPMATPVGQLHGVSCAGTGCTLTAMEGTVVVNDGSTSGATPGKKTLHVWKFTDTTGSAAPALGAVTDGAASAVLEGTVGVPMTIIIHNALSIPVGLSIPQLDSENPDGTLQLHEVTAGDGGIAVVEAAADAAHDKTYTFTPNRAGTFTYQAALTDNGSRGVAMGLVGALVVRPSTDPLNVSAKVGGPSVDAGAYDDQELAFDDEAVLVYTDVDSAMATDPIAFNMRSYRPDYHLINGQAYPDVPSISSAPGNVVMVRVVNGSILEKSPTILGTRFNQFAVGTRPLPNRLSVSGRLVQTGDTFDALVTMPDIDKVRYAIYDAPGSLRNGDEVNLAASAAKNAPAVGGGFVLIESGFEGNGENTGATVTNLVAAGQPGSGSSPLQFSASLASQDGADISDVQMYLDSLTTPIPIDFGSTCGASCDASWTVDGTLLGALPSGVHPVWVRAKTGNSAWGPYALIKIRVDNVGPVVTQLALSDPSTNAKTDLDITATLDERTTGGSMVKAGRYWISTGTGETEPGTAAVQGVLTVNGPRLIASGDATIVAGTVDPADPNQTNPTLPLIPTAYGNLAEGTYRLYVQGQDDRDTWGAASAATLVIDKTAPLTGTITLDPMVTNGLQGSATKPGNVRITATVSDALSTVTAVDGYLDSVKPAGNANGLYFSHGSRTTWTADMPLSWLAGKKTDGPVTVYVVGTDAAGNRSTGAGATERKTILLDRTKPAVSMTSLSTVNGTRVLRFAGSFGEVVPVPAAPTSGIAFAEWFIGTDPGLGKGTRIVGPYAAAPTSIPVSIDYNLVGSGLSRRTITVTLRTKDLAGNVATTSRSLRIGNIPNTFANGFAVTERQQWTAGPLGVRGAARLLPVGGPAGQRALSVTLGAVGYVEKRLQGVVRGGTLATLTAGFSLSIGRTYPGCSSAAASSCKPVTVFTGVGANGKDVVSVQYQRRTATSKPLFRVVVATNSSGTRVTAGRWTAVPVASSYSLTVGWRASTKGGAVLRVNKTAVAAASANTASLRVATLRLGVLKAAPRAAGRVLFDAFYLI